MKEKSLIIKNNSSNQLDTEEDYLSGINDVIEPYVSFSLLRGLYASNVYHQRAIKIKAGLLSQIEETNLQDFLPKGTTAKSFLYKLMLNLEAYGTAFIEKSGIGSNYNLYTLNTYHARIDINHQIHQLVNMESQKLEGMIVKYDSLLSDYYGEPDYLTIIRTISTLFKADTYNSKFFENGGKPELAFIFEDSDPSDTQVEAITEFVKKNFNGVDNSHKNLILTTGEGNGETKPKIRIEQIGKVEDLSFKQLKEVGRDEIASAHGTPPRLLGIVQGSGLGGSGELLAQMEMFLEITMKPKIELVESFFEQHGIKLKLKRFDISGLGSKDAGDVLVKAGVITEIEKRNILGD